MGTIGAGGACAARPAGRRFAGLPGRGAGQTCRLGARRLGAGRDAPRAGAQPALMRIRLAGFVTSGGLGTVMVSTPLANSAVTSSGLGAKGSWRVRTKAP